MLSSTFEELLFHKANIDKPARVVCFFSIRFYVSVLSFPDVLFKWAPISLFLKLPFLHFAIYFSEIGAEIRNCQLFVQCLNHFNLFILNDKRHFVCQLNLYKLPPVSVVRLIGLRCVCITV